MNKSDKFVSFLTNLSECNPMLMESIINGYKLIYENTENRVNNIKATLGTPEENPLDITQPDTGDMEPDINVDPMEDIEQPIEDPQLNQPV